MNKSFRSLVLAINEKKDAQEYENDERVLKPRSKGEADFAKVAGGLPTDRHEPNDEDDPGGTDDVGNARSAKKTDMHGMPTDQPKDKTFPKQGSSSPDQKNSQIKGFQSFSKAVSNQTPARRGDNLSNGDEKPVRLSKSAVEPLKEGDVLAHIKHIAASGKTEMVEFADGDSALVSKQMAVKLMEVHSKLRPVNARVFVQRINASPQGLLQMMKFSGSV